MIHETQRRHYYFTSKGHTGMRAKVAQQSTSILINTWLAMRNTETITEMETLYYIEQELIKRGAGYIDEETREFDLIEFDF